MSLESPVAAVTSRSVALLDNTKLVISSALSYTKKVPNATGQGVPVENTIQFRNDPSTCCVAHSEVLISERSACYLLELPLEVRYLIYEYVFSGSEINIRGKTRDVANADPFPGACAEPSMVSAVNPLPNVDETETQHGRTSLLLTCKTIRAEAMRVFLAKARFVVVDDVLNDLERNFPRLALEASHMIVASSKRHHLDAFRAYMVRNNCKIPHLTISGRNIGSMLCPYLIGPLSACCSRTLVRSIEFDVEVQHFLNSSHAPLEGNDEATFRSQRNSTILTFVEDTGDWVCTKLVVFGRMRADVTEFLELIECCADDRRWLLTADVEVVLTENWPHRSYEAKVVRQKKFTDGLPRIFWYPEEKESCWWTLLGYQVVSLE